MTLSTIQPIGKNPITTPRMLARIAMPAGIVKMMVATRIAARSAINAAKCALTFPEASRTSSVTTGIAAANVDRNSLFSGL